MTSFKHYIADKLRKVFSLGAFLLSIALINYGLWTTGPLLVLIFIAALLLIKFVVILLRGFQVSHEFGKPIRATIIFTFFFLAASSFDFMVIPNLWVENFGFSTEGTVTDLRSIKYTHRSSHIATYTFNANGSLITKSQSISSSLYKKLMTSPVAEIKYLSENPNRAYLRDPAYLKMNTFITLTLGFGMLFLLYSYKPENKLRPTSNDT